MRGINAKGAAVEVLAASDRRADGVCQARFGAKGLAWFRVEDDGKLWSPIAKNFSRLLLAELAQRMGAEPGDLLLFVADTLGGHLQGAVRPAQAAGRRTEALRPEADALLVGRRVPDVRVRRGREALGRDAPSVHLAARPGLRDAGDRSRHAAAPRPTTWSSTATKRAAARSVFTIAASSSRCSSCWASTRSTAKERFGFLLDALQYGAPPHGGIALGIDRIVMLFGGLDNIRDCIAFPKTQRAADLMTEAPGPVDLQQLQELNIRVVPLHEK